MAILFTDFAEDYGFNAASFVNRKTADLGLSPASNYYCEQVTPANGLTLFNLRPISDYPTPAVPQPSGSSTITIPLTASRNVATSDNGATLTYNGVPNIVLTMPTGLSPQPGFAVVQLGAGSVTVSA
jgi:uncharacterized membrane protein